MVIESINLICERPQISCLDKIYLINLSHDFEMQFEIHSKISVLLRESEIQKVGNSQKK